MKRVGIMEGKGLGKRINMVRKDRLGVGWLFHVQSNINPFAVYDFLRPV